jgi:transcriptional regulator with XRE-family HTH domain
MSLAVQPCGTFDAQVGGRVRIRRRLLGLSQDTVAASLGVSVEAVRQIECGQRPLRPTDVLALTELLEMSADFLLGEIGFRLRSSPTSGRPDPTPAP